MCANDKDMKIGPKEWQFIKEELIKPYMISLQEYSKNTRKDIKELKDDFKAHINRDTAQENKLSELFSIIKRSLIPALNRVTKFVKDCRAGEPARIGKAVGSIKKAPVWQSLILYLAVISGLTGGVVLIAKEVYGLEQMKAAQEKQEQRLDQQDAIIQALPNAPSQ